MNIESQTIISNIQNQNNDPVMINGNELIKTMQKYENLSPITGVNKPRQNSEITINTIAPLRILKTLNIRGNENFDIPIEIVVDFNKIPTDKHELAYNIILQLYSNPHEDSEVKITWFDKLKNIFKGI